MRIVERATIVKATPETIWNACFEHMKFDVWDPDIIEIRDLSGGCANGTTFTCVMKNGQKVPTMLSYVIKNQSLTLEGTSSGLVFDGTIVLSPTPSASETKIGYTFTCSIGGCLGRIFASAI